MKKISFQTKSFLILLTFIAIGSAAVFGLYTFINKEAANEPYDNLSKSGYTIIKHQEKQPEVKNANIVPPVDTSTWKTYENSDFKFSFMYNPSWTVKAPIKKGDYTVFDIDPGKKFFNIQIFISEKGYYIMEGLPEVAEQINGVEFKNVNNMLFGAFKSPYYFTFDLGKSASLLPDFYALVHSVKFE